MNTILCSSDIPPVNLNVGIDQYSFEIKAGSPFKGIKNIPDGIHVIHFGTTSQEENDSIRYGYWFEYPGDYRIHYDDKSETFKLIREMDHEKYDRMVERHHPFMVNYPKIEEDALWVELTKYITWDQIKGTINAEPAYVDSSMTSFEESQLLRETLQKGHHDGGHADDDKFFQYTKIKFKSRDAIRDHCKMEDFMDKSYYLNKVIIGRDFKGHIGRLIGELQFSFLNAMIYGNYGSSLQWHNIIELICLSSSVDSATIKSLDHILTLQLKNFPQEYVDVLLNENMWHKCLTDSYQSNNLPHTKRILEERIPSFFTSDDGIEEDHDDDDDDDEDDEYKPTIAGGVYYCRP